MKYVILLDGSKGRHLEICGGRRRESPVYVSESNKLEIRLTTRNKFHFLIKFESKTFFTFVKKKIDSALKSWKQVFFRYNNRNITFVISIIWSYLLSFSRRMSRYQETPECASKEKGQSSHDRVFNQHGYGNNAWHYDHISNINSININKESFDTTGQYEIHWHFFWHDFTLSFLPIWISKALNVS